MTARPAAISLLAVLLLVHPTPARAQGDGEPTLDESEAEIEAEPEMEAESEPEPESDEASGPTRAEIDVALGSALARHPLAFCLDANRPIASDERPLCSLAEPARERCLAFLEACRRDPGDASMEPKRSSRAAFGARSDLGFVLFWIVLAVGLVVLIWALVKNFRGRFDEAASGEHEPSEQPEAAAAPQPREVETDVGKLLARARAAAERGDYALAISTAYAAALRHLEIEGRIELHPSRTNGDYVRALRQDRDLYERLREVTGEVDRAVFAPRAPSRAAFDRVLSRVLPLVGQATLVLLLVAGMSGVTACRRSAAREDRGTATSLGTSPGGYALLSALLSERGATVRRHLTAIDELPEDTSAVLVLGAELEPDDWDLLLERANRGATLLVAGPLGSAAERLGLESAGPGCSESLKLEVDAFAGFDDAVVHGKPSTTLRKRDDSNRTILSCSGRPHLLTRSWGSGSVIVAGDASFFSNASLLAGDDARVVAALLSDLGSVEIVDEWTMATAKTPFEAMSNAHFAPLLLQALLLLLLLGVSRGAHFGAPRDPRRTSRLAFADHVRALGLAYARSRASRVALASYSAWVLDRLRERALPAGGRLVDLAQAVAARTGRSEGEVMRALVDARSAWEEAGPPSRASVPPRSVGGARTRDAESLDLVLMRELGVMLEKSGGRKRENRRA